MPDAPYSLPALLSWFKSQGVVWNEELLDIRSGLPSTGGGCLGVYARTDIDEGAVLCDIPKASILSVKTTSIADILEDAKIAGGLGLTIAVMHEYSIRKKSRWCVHAMHACPSIISDLKLHDISQKMLVLHPRYLLVRFLFWDPLPSQVEL
jgi:hypothetical protein